SCYFIKSILLVIQSNISLESGQNKKELTSTTFLYCTSYLLDTQRPTVQIINLMDSAPVVPPSPPTATLLQSSTELVCLVQGFNPAPINITWFLNHVTELLEHNTTGPSQGLDGTFTVISHLRTSISDSTPGTVYTCAVTHGTTWLRVNISKQGPFLYLCVFGVFLCVMQNYCNKISQN
uniref:Ig-like domain-containing protein n=1 Tax=Scleropages formosus TaxID=113540 RepID=A0A8C9SCZ0_SCLFO